MRLQTTDSLHVCCLVSDFGMLALHKNDHWIISEISGMLQLAMFDYLRVVVNYFSSFWVRKNGFTKHQKVVWLVVTGT